MPPTLALILWLVLLLALLYLDPAREPQTSLALWVPLIWMFTVGSKLPSQWLGGQMGMAAVALEEGNPLDRAFYSLLILLAIFILISRSFNWGGFVARNFALTTFLLFALMSVLWSDFPFVAFKRWFRDLGNYLVVLVVLTDPRPLEAIRTVFRRFSFLVIPLSILLIKYYPGVGIRYNFWIGSSEYLGVTTGKNLLGAVCLISGLFFFWDTVTRWADRREGRTKRILLVNIAFIAMTLWLLMIANSATSRVCLGLGCLIIAVAQTRTVKRRPVFVKALIVGGLTSYLILALGVGMNAQIATAVGRDPTMTDRTQIWSILLGMHTNPLVGTGYESFWLGPRLQWFWQHSGQGRINEAHNGYLEIYLNLGLAGLFLLVGFLIASYRTICRRLTPFSSLASFTLALWTIAVFYNVTEAAFKWHIMWITFLLGAIAIPEHAEDRVQIASSFDDAGATQGLAELPLETKGLPR